MKNKEVLEFYADNELDEIIGDKPCNYLVQEEVEKQVEKKSHIELNKVNSAFDGLSILAKRQNIDLSHQLSVDANFTRHDSPPALQGAPRQNEINDNQESFYRSPELTTNVKFMIAIEEIVNEAKSLAAKARNVAELKQAVENFDGCNLKKMATNTVFCDGNPESKIMVIGEAPGNHEDLRGIPFCGDSGQLLDSMFHAINFERAKDFYITNTIFWRPPGNRKPTEEELMICRPFLERHIELFKPKLIILVGATAMSAILKTSASISSMRGKFMDFAPEYLSEKTKTFIIFHPSYLMRQSNKKKEAWLDMLEIERFTKEFLSK